MTPYTTAELAWIVNICKEPVPEYFQSPTVIEDLSRLAAEVIALRKVLEPLAQIARDAATRDDLVIPNGMRVQIPLSLCRAVAALLPPEPS